jgi:hypothetical protein
MEVLCYYIVGATHIKWSTGRSVQTTAAPTPMGSCAVGDV